MVKQVEPIARCVRKEGLVRGYPRLFSYNDWANRESLTSLAVIAAPPNRAMTLLGHVIGAEWLWLGRLWATPPPPVWPEFSVEQAALEFPKLLSAWRRTLATLDPPGLDRIVAYTNSKGESWSSRVEDILNHVLLHSAQHRGQIASCLRDHGFTPAYSDYIHGVRNGLVG